jgi:hypothetical protein
MTFKFLVTINSWCTTVELALSVDGLIKNVLAQHLPDTLYIFCGNIYRRFVLTVNSCIKVCLDLQADKSPVVVKGPFFTRVVNPRYRIRGIMCNARIQSSKARKANL